MTQTSPTPTPKAPNPDPGFPSLHLDWEDWMSEFEDCDATDAERRQMIETLWQIVISFVDLGWDISPNPKNSGQVLDLHAALSAAVLHSKDAEHPEKEAV